MRVVKGDRVMVPGKGIGEVKVVNTLSGTPYSMIVKLDSGKAVKASIFDVRKV